MILFLTFEKGISQVPVTKVSVGCDVMGNILQGDFNNHPLFLSGDLFAKWDISTLISVYGAFTFGELHTSLDANELAQLPDYPPKIVTDYSSLEIYGGITLYQSWFLPQFLLGGELLRFDPKGAEGAPLPPKNFNRNVLGFLIGLAFEFPLSKRLSVNIKTILHLTGTDYLDYYVAGSTPDAYTTFGGGLSYSFGSNSLNPK